MRLADLPKSIGDSLRWEMPEHLRDVPMPRWAEVGHHWCDRFHDWTWSWPGWVSTVLIVLIVRTWT